jgi:hypothetical protein
MSVTPTYYVNSPVSGTHYGAFGGYWYKPNNGTSVTVTVKTFTGANGGGSLVVVSTLTADVHDQQTNTDLNTFTGSSANTTNASGTGNGDWFQPFGWYTGSTPGSLGMFATYTGVAYIPTVSSLSPGNGGVGTSVVITGTNFHDATGVDFNGTSASFTVNSDTQITATVPSGATTGLVHVSNQSGSGASPSNFIVAQMYVNTGTPASPVWTPGPVYVNSGTPASPVWTAAQALSVNTGTPASPVWTPGN